MKSWPALIGTGNPENGDYLAGLRESQREGKTMKLFPDECTYPNCECKDASPYFIARCSAGRNSEALKNPAVLKEREHYDKEIRGEKIK